MVRSFLIHFSVALLLTVVIFLSVLMDLDFEAMALCPNSLFYVQWFQRGILLRTMLWLWEYFFYLKNFYLDTSYYHVQMATMFVKCFMLCGGLYLHYELDRCICNVEYEFYFQDTHSIPDHVWAIFYLMVFMDMVVLLSFFIGFFFYGFLYKMNMLKISSKSF